MSEQKSERNYGVDLLRLVAMFFVVLLHSFLRGGLLEGKNQAVFGATYQATWFLEAFALCAVNVFAMISGYVGYRPVAKRQKYSSLILLWLQVIFYGVIIALIVKFCTPVVVGWSDVARSALPLFNHHYWYLTAYVGLFFLMPILDAAARALSEKQLKSTVCIMLTVFCGLAAFGLNWDGFEGGYSVIWLAIMYLAGAMVKKCNFGAKLRGWQCMLGILGLTVAGWLWWVSGVDMKFLGVSLNYKNAMSYLAPTVVGSAFLWLIWFSKLWLPDFMVRLARFAAPGAFAVYILNCNQYIWQHVLTWQVPLIGTIPGWKLLLTAIAFSILFFVFAIFIDWLRQLLFKLFRIDKFVAWLERKAGAVKDFLARKHRRRAGA